ncbi:phosphatidylserine decarboxylase family protein [Hymenobacter lutimineralis]|uniref:Phosphatidylserine decarboxylase proenzyme n=1 Tax=Hymenobacter lutimineralis TaxID=2606448 RepID=A0A5D6V2P9_9BACT|nr:MULTISPECIES: phosphatidylserine decarboxylase family protein [Hymenobacter]QIX61442.1 phosphatidylserine decarboxylase family protein [Hymenobacter sp. BT18]TYZ08854.1 phosphatidylserine decarboxylase family protein [Hymenobacter lutimineralis]
MKIHKEGRRILFFTLLALLAVNLLLFRYNAQNDGFNKVFAVISVLVFLILLQFFRSPARRLFTHEDLVIAPADGKVVVIEDVHEPEYFDDVRKQISIFMSPINVHITRNPISGIVRYFKYHPGNYLVAWHPKSSTKNERTTVVVESEAGPFVLFRQIAGAMARRIVWYVNEGDEVSQGEEFGFIKFGSRVDIFVPLDTEVKVQIGEKVKGGQTIIAQLKTNAPSLF